jgi:nicotinate-nucleotide adenylyltransferase
LGHLHVITQLIEKNLVDQLLVIPAGEPLLREKAPIATAQQRRTMCQLALADLPPAIASKVQVNPIEILRMGPSYAIDTVEAVAQNYPGDTIIFVIGQDAAEKLEQWHRIDELRAMVEFLVIGRPGFDWCVKCCRHHNASRFERRSFVIGGLIYTRE